MARHVVATCPPAHARHGHELERETRRLLASVEPAGDLSELSFGGVLSDTDYEELLELPDASPWRLRIDPYLPFTKVPGMLSYGQSPYGYDLRLGSEWVYVDERELRKRGIPFVRPGLVPEECVFRHESQAFTLGAHQSVRAEQVQRHLRSEERREGKECHSECRARWAPYH